MTSPIPTERDTSVAADQRRGYVPHPAVLRVLIPLLSWLMPLWAGIRSTFRLAAAEAVSAAAERDLDAHFAGVPRNDDRYWPADTPARAVVTIPPAAELDGPDYREVLAFLLALGKVDAAGPADQVLLRARDRAEDIHPRSLHLAATYLAGEFVTLARSTR